jgi:hypothetical protein
MKEGIWIGKSHSVNAGKGAFEDPGLQPADPGSLSANRGVTIARFVSRHTLEIKMKTRTVARTSVFAALMLTLGVAGVRAQPLNITISGTNVPSAADLGTGTPTSEYDLASNGGSFTFRALSSSSAASQPSSTCSGASKIYVPTVAGIGVLRSPDGSLLQLAHTGGSDCIDLNAGNAFCIRTYEVIRGTGRFQTASGGTVTLTMTVAPVVPGNFAMFVVTTGEITGTVQD